MPYRIKMSERHGSLYFEAYFLHLPSKVDVERAIQHEETKAPVEYSFWYSQLKDACKEFEWPQCWGYSTKETGSSANDDIYVRIKRIEIIQNQ